MKIFKLIAGIFILFVIATGLLVLLVMAVPLPGAEATTFLGALIFSAEFYGGLAVAAGVTGLVWFALHLITSALKEDKKNENL